MLYAKISDINEVLEWPITEQMIRNRLQNMSLPTDLSKLKEIGYVQIGDDIEGTVPVATKDKKLQLDGLVLSADGTTWKRKYILVDMQPLQARFRVEKQWPIVRKKRDQLMQDLEWRIARNSRETRLGMVPTESIVDLDTCMQTLADITKMDDPFLVVYPSVPLTSPTSI